MIPVRRKTSRTCLPRKDNNGYNKFISKVRRLGGQFQHNRPSNEYLIGNEILQNEVTGTQTSFSTNVGGKLSFILSFLIS
jgi:hypothetical protein